MFIFEQIRVGGDRNFSYLVGDSDAGEAVIVDPSYDPARVVERARAQHLRVTHVINTHGHQDHTNGNDEACRLTGAPLAAYKDAASSPNHPLDHGDTLRVGALTAEFFYTPGHADDHLCIRVDDVLITGDLLFVGKIGGTATREASETEYRSLHDHILTLPDHLSVWPGHDYGARPASTLALEKRTNPFLLCPDLESFLDLKKNWSTFKAERGLC